MINKSDCLLRYVTKLYENVKYFANRRLMVMREYLKRKPLFILVSYL